MLSHFLRTVCVALVVLVSPLHADLQSYLKKPEPKSSWSLVEKTELGACEIYVLKLTSQVWQGIPWEHDLVLYRPKEGDVSDKMYLLNNGGKLRASGHPYGVMLATMMKAPVAILLGIPNQPLFDGKREDDLIAETFVRFLESKDGAWPLLFPMVKSLVKAMDAVQELSARDWPKRIEKFAVGGASKRGWTTWLTAATDPRVMAITPMVIDVLNMPDQLKRQVECFGAPSEQIRPYTARGLVPIPDTPEGKALWQSVDPWTYRDKFSMPKIVVLGSNDRYWAPDALNLYWEGLPGPKWISYSPNAGHDLMMRDGDGKKQGAMRAVNATAAFVRHQFTGKPMPDLGWLHDDAGAEVRLTVTSTPAPTEVRVWTCQAPTKDTRNARWTSEIVPFRDGKAVISRARPPSGVVSFFADCTYEIDGLPYALCTQLRLVEPAK